MKIFFTTTMALFLTIGFIFTSLVIAEEVYKTVDENGRVTFSSKGSQDAKKIDVRGANKVTLPKLEAVEGGSETQLKAKKYQSLAFTNPSETQTDLYGKELPYRLNATVSLKPNLQSNLGHRYQFYFDGKKVGKLSTNGYIGFGDLYRGSHTMAVAVVDTLNRNKVLIRSETMTVNIHQNSAPRKAPRAN